MPTARYGQGTASVSNDGTDYNETNRVMITKESNKVVKYRRRGSDLNLVRNTIEIRTKGGSETGERWQLQQSSLEYHEDLFQLVPFRIA